MKKSSMKPLGCDIVPIAVKEEKWTMAHDVNGIPVSLKVDELIHPSDTEGIQELKNPIIVFRRKKKYYIDGLHHPFTRQ